MNRRWWVVLPGLLLVLSGCIPQEQPAHSEPGDPSTPTRPPAGCPANGAELGVGVVDAALGHRAVTITLTNCSPGVMTIDGYPEIAVLDAERNKLKVTVAHDSSYMARDPGPTRIRLAKGESALAAVSWSNTVEMGAGKAAGAYLSIARGKGDQPVIWPVVTDIGTTAKIELTAWCLKFPT